MHAVARREAEGVDAPLAGRVEAGPREEVCLLEGGGRADQPPIAAHQMEQVEHVRAHLDRLTLDRREYLRDPRVEEIHPWVAAGVAGQQGAAMLPEAVLAVDVVV